MMQLTEPVGVLSLGPLVGIKETFAELFAHLECTPNYNGNPEDELFVAILPDYVEYGLGELPALIGLYSGNYTVVFRLGEC